MHGDTSSKHVSTHVPINNHLELQFLKQKIAALEETITTESLKILVVCGLELYLSQALVLSLFECIYPDKRDAKELEYMERMAWIPLLWGLILAYGYRLLPSIAPNPENLDRNLRNAKLLTWVYTLVFLIWDKDMELKRGPALQVAVMFSVCDLARFEMEINHLIDDDDNELEADADIQNMAEAVDVAARATNEEEAFKAMRQMIADQNRGAESNEEEAERRTHAGGNYVHQTSDQSIIVYGELKTSGGQSRYFSED